MEMTKMLLPAVPSMGKIHSNDKYDKRFLYRDLTEFRDSIFLSRLETGKFLKVVRESLLIENLDLLHFPYYDSQRNARPSANEEHRYDVPTTPNEKKTEIQSSLQCQSKPEPQPEPEPKPEPKPQPELKPISNPEPEIEPETETESESELGLPEWEAPLNKKQKSGLDSIPVWDYDSDDGMMTIGHMCKMYDSDDEFAKRTWPNDANSKPTPTSISEEIKRCKEKLKNVFIRREDGGNCMWPIVGKYQPIKRCFPANYQYEVSNVQRRRCNTRTTLTRNLSNRSLLKSQRNVNNTFSPTNTWENPLPSNNQEKKLCDQNQDYQRKIVMPYTQQAIDSQEAEIKQLLSSSSDDDLMDTDTEVDELPVFRHDHINVHEKLNEYLSEGASTSRSLPRNEEPTQRVKRYWRKNEENQRQIEDNIMRNTLSDHCYHLNQPRSMERLELSDSSSDEEIDVVSYERQITQQNDSETIQHNAAQTTQQNIPQASQHNVPQATPHNVPQTKRNTTSRANQDANENNSPAARRPRGRPPGPNSTKRRKTGQTNQTPDLAPTSSSSRVQNHQRTERRQNSTSSRQNRNDNEKSKRRSLHNDMERMRRDGLKQMFALVHKSIPAIKNNEKASKLAVLEHARTYIYSLQDVQSSLKHEKARLEEYNQRLLKRLKCAKRVSSLPRKN